MAVTGGCLCGATRYAAAAPPVSVVNCHCTMCRKHSGAAFLTYAQFKMSDVHFTGSQPVAYRSSAGASRSHCGTCGSPIGFFYDGDPDSLYLTIGSLDDAQLLQPTADWYIASRLPWVHLDDSNEHWPGLPF